MDHSTPALLVVMGTSGCGKSSIGLAVAQALGIPFVDGDDLHPKENVDKMSKGVPLTDEVSSSAWGQRGSSVDRRDDSIGFDDSLDISFLVGTQKEQSSGPTPNATLTPPGCPSQDRIPWLRKIRETAKVLTSPEAVSTMIHPTKPTQEEDPVGALSHALANVHPASIAPARERAKGKRRAVVVGCSALRVTYRDILRGKGDGMDEEEMRTYFIYLHGTRPLLLNRMQHRPGHFFGPGMLDSQLSTLEEPTPAEENVATIRLGKGKDDAEEIGMERVVAESVEVARSWIG
ncbi:gluconokinase, partial [Phenoliferia sp. Uapishka_3]